MCWGSLPLRGAAPDASAAQQWPALRAGVWETESTRTLPSGKTQAWKDVISECHDPAEMVRGYWGLGIVEAAGCQYEAARTAPDEFRVTSECMVRHAGVARSVATVKTKDNDAFEMTVKVVEGRKVYRATHVGHRRSDCPPRQGAL